jgi:phosphate transport system substrate-binding protein
LGAGAVSFFQARVLQGGAMWNEDLREYDNLTKMLADLRRDPDGIAYAPLTYGNDGLKPIMLASTAAGPYVALTGKTVGDRSYPLARPVYIDYTIDDERSQIANPRVDPKVDEFMRFVLSAQGQAIVRHDGTFLPLTATVVRRQLQILQSRGIPPEKVLLRE